MIRMNMSRAGSALLGALIAKAGLPATALRLSSYRATEWRAATLDGERHEFGLSLAAEADAAGFDRLLDGLDDHEFEIGRWFVADIVASRSTDRGTPGTVLIEALTISG